VVQLAVLYMTNSECCFQTYKKITKNDPEGKLYRIYLQLWDTAGQERYLIYIYGCQNKVRCMKGLHTLL